MNGRSEFKRIATQQAQATGHRKALESPGRGLKSPVWSQLFLVLCLGFLGYLWLPKVFLEASLDGIPAVGRVVALVPPVGALGEFEVDYQFVARGTPITASACVRRSAWTDLVTGEPLAVRFLPSDPRVSDIAGNFWNLALTLMVVPWLIIGAQALYALPGLANLSTQILTRSPMPVRWLLGAWLLGGPLLFAVYNLT